jgi:hypothetical protein
LLLAVPQETLGQSQVATIDTLVAGVNRFIKVNRKSARVFADVSGIEDSNPQWREFRNEDEMEKARTGDNLNEIAFVWTRASKVIGTSFTFTSPSGDWAHLVTYYFREDGSLAKISAQLNTFYGDLSVIRVQYFNDRGVVLKSTSKYLDLKTQKPKKPDGDFFDREVPVYGNVRELPFHKLL